MYELCCKCAIWWNESLEFDAPLACSKAQWMWLTDVVLIQNGGSSETTSEEEKYDHTLRLMVGMYA